MRSLTLCGLASALLVSGGGHTDRAHGAVRKCLPLVKTEASDTVSEADARRKALEKWLAIAAKEGTAFTRFALAADRNIDCRKLDSGAYACSVAAMPCAVLQNPNLLPPEAYRARTPPAEPLIDKKP